MSEKQYDNTNRGAAWINTRKETETHPTHTGSINIDGKEYWLNIWENANSEGNRPVFNLSVREKEDAPAEESKGGAKKAAPKAAAKKAAPAAEDDSNYEDIPF